MYCYRDDGFSINSVPDDYEAQPGEFLAADIASEDELNQAFPSRVVALTAEAQKFLVDTYTTAAQVMLDAEARERNYDGILSLCSYATSTVPRFRDEGQAGVRWRDAVWATAYDVLSRFQAGQMATPTVEEFLEMLPAMAWPEA